MTRRALSFVESFAAAARLTVMGAATLLIAVFGRSAALAAEAPEIAVSDRAEVSLVADHAVAAPGDAVAIALVQRLSPGWHRYWRNPGDSGMETTLVWKGFLSDEPPVPVGDIEWPAPQRLPIPPLMNYGFKDEAVLVSVAQVPADWPAGTPLDFTVEADWLVCADICVPERQTFSLSVSTGETSEIHEPGAVLVAQGRASQPAPFAGPARFEVSEDEASASVWIGEPALADPAITEIAVFPHEWGVDTPAAAQVVERRADGVRVTLARGHTPLGDTLPAVITAVDASTGGEPVMLALNFSATRGAAPVVEAAAPASGLGGGGAVIPADLGLGLGASVWAAMALAFLGGLILNLMPCVFPVLALKALSLAKSADAPARERLGHGLAYAAGVMTLYLGFAAALVALQQAGAAAGWGFQLQSPWVVAVLALGLTAVGLNFSGVFEIGGVALAGPSGAARSGLGESYATGALAAVVASPCTAPFMGAALGFAVTQPPATALAVFAALGVGFAAPIVALSAAPGVARALPRPGPWMARFRQALAFPMYLTAAWLVWVLGGQAGLDAAFALLAGCVFLGFGAWALGAGWPESRAGRRIAGVAAAAAFAGAIAAPASWINAEPGRIGGLGAAEAAAGIAPSEPFDPARLAALRADGRTVFVNVTADWCISCKVNERVTLAGASFAAQLDAADAVYMKADWTRRDAVIGDYLRGYGRVGVPLYVVYQPGAEPKVLPQILSPSLLGDALGAG